MNRNLERSIICLFIFLQFLTCISTYNVDRKKTGDVTIGVPTCDGGTRVALNDSTRSHECVKEMNSPVTGKLLYITNKRRSFSTSLMIF